MTNARRQHIADKRLEYRLDLWRLRGQAARQARQPRRMPHQPASTTAEIRDLVAEAWLAGYDGR